MSGTRKPQASVSCIIVPSGQSHSLELLDELLELESLELLDELLELESLELLDDSELLELESLELLDDSELLELESPELLDDSELLELEGIDGSVPDSEKENPFADKTDLLKVGIFGSFFFFLFLSTIPLNPTVGVPQSHLHSSGEEGPQVKSTTILSQQ